MAGTAVDTPSPGGSGRGQWTVVVDTTGDEPAGTLRSPARSRGRTPGEEITLEPFAMMVLRRPGRASPEKGNREGPVRHCGAGTPGTGRRACHTQPPGWCASSTPRASRSPWCCPTTAPTTPPSAQTSPSTCPAGWASPLSAAGRVGDGVPLVAVRTPAIERAHPYNDGDGRGWQDNDFRFMAFSAAVARAGRQARPGRPPRQRLAHRGLPGDGAPTGALGVHHPQPRLPGDGRRGLGRGAPPPARGLRVARHGQPDVGGDRPGRPGGGGEPQLRPRDPPAGGRVRARRTAPGEG